LTSGVIEVVFNTLNDATSGLILSELDTLTVLVTTTTSNLDASNYISSTYDPFNEARTSGVLVLDAIASSGIFTIYEGSLITSGLLEQTINELNQSLSLVEFEAYASLNAFVIQSVGLSAENFEPTQFATFDAALQSGLSIQSAVTTSGALAEFDTIRLTSGVIQAVDDAIRSAVTTLNFSGLATLSGLLQTTSGLDETNFTTGTWSAFDVAINSGNIIIGVVIDSGAFARYEEAPLSAIAILDVTTQINITYTGLIYSGALELQQVVETAEGLNAALYTTSTYDQFSIALTSGQSILTSIVSDTPRAMIGDALVTSGLIAEITQAILDQQAALVFKIATTEEELYLMTIEPINISTITLGDDLALSGLSEQIIGDTLVFDFKDKVMTGNLSITTMFSGVVELGSGTLNGNLTFSGINATVNNNLTVTGTVTIEAISSSTWNQNGDSQQMVLTANGGTINFTGGTSTSGLVVSGLEKTNLISIGGTLTNIDVQIDAISSIELLTEATNVTLTQPVNLTLNEDVTLTITGAGDVSTLALTSNVGLTLSENSTVPQSILDALPTLNQTTGKRYQSIQAAVSTANAHDVIVVSSGLYEEDIVITTALVLSGVGDVTLQSGSIRITASGVTIDNFDLINSYLPRINHSDITIQNTTIRHDQILDYYIYESGVGAMGDRYLIKFFNGISNINIVNVTLEGPGQNEVVDSGIVGVRNRSEGEPQPTDYVLGGIDFNGVLSSTISNVSISGLSRFGINIGKELTNISSGILLESIAISNTGVSNSFFGAILFNSGLGPVTLSGMMNLSNNNVGFALYLLVEADLEHIITDDSYELSATGNQIDAITTYNEESSGVFQTFGTRIGMPVGLLPSDLDHLVPPGFLYFFKVDPRPTD
jgi:hypothetical protein